MLTKKKAVAFWNLDDFLKCLIIESYFADLDIKNFSIFLTKFGTSGHSDYCDEYKIRRDWLEYLRTT